PDIIKKTFTIPILPKKEQRDALNWTSAKVLSLSLDDMVYEHTMLGRMEEKGIMKDEVLFVGTSKGFIQRVSLAFQQAGFRDVVLVTDIAFAYVYALGEVGERSVAVVDVGGRQTGLYIANGRRLMFAREILTASESFSDALMSGPGLSFDEAEQYKKERGFDAELTEILKIPFERLAGEVQRTFSVYNQHYPDKAVTQVYVTGRGARIPRFMEKLEETLVEQVDRLETLHSIEDKYIPAQALSMNLDVLPNLLPEGAKRRETNKVFKRFAMVGTAAIAAILILLSLGMWRTSKNVDLRLQAEKGSLEQIKKGIESLGLKSVKVSIDPGDIGFIRNQIQKKDITFVTLLKYLSSKTPDGIYLKAVEFGGEFPAEGAAVPDKGQQASAPVPPAPPASAAQAKGETGRKPMENEYPLVLTGYIFAEADALELKLFDFLLSLKGSGFIQQVEVVRKENKTVRGKPVLEFALSARCSKHEL
ncbi:MAG: pilus assembly protein PilM, partial [Syntrophorhabdaceae bacterium]|nr:pilus assembly protein PilM [Syntrophorhabdaceae bacterium]